MKAQELRLRNRVKWDGKEGIIVAIEDQYVSITLDNGFHVRASIRSVKGIELTPELLNRSGFANHYSGFWDNDALSVFIHKDGTPEVSYNSRSFPHIKYLHQLQNAFYILTGTELKITL